MKIRWRKAPEEKDYAAATAYLSLLFEPKEAAGLVRDLRKTATRSYIARDVLRASGSSLVGIAASEDERDGLMEHDQVAPLLLVRHRKTAQVVVADGYHRLCTLYTIDPQSIVYCRIV